jgi:hypothetical protein
MLRNRIEKVASYAPAPPNKALHRSAGSAVLMYALIAAPAPVKAGVGRTLVTDEAGAYTARTPVANRLD